jgi:hypothetical protein
VDDEIVNGEQARHIDCGALVIALSPGSARLGRSASSMARGYDTALKQKEGAGRAPS